MLSPFFWETQRLMESWDGKSTLPLSLGYFFGLVLVQIVILEPSSAFSHVWMYFVLWLIPLLILTKTLSKIKNAVGYTATAENACIVFARYRTIRAPILEKFFLSPLNFNYHTEHHLHPSIPFFNLPKAHQLLSSHPSYRIHPPDTRLYVLCA